MEKTDQMQPGFRKMVRTLREQHEGSNSLLIDGLEVLPPLEHLRACEVTDEQRKQARESELWKRGDMVLIWVNEGDLIAAGVQHF